MARPWKSKALRREDEAQPCPRKSVRVNPSPFKVRPAMGVVRPGTASRVCADEWRQWAPLDRCDEDVAPASAVIDDV